MTTYRITAPDGTVYRVTAPEGATEQEALQRVQAQYNRQPAEPMPTPDPTGTFGENFAAGAGKAVADAGRGLRQIGSMIPGLNRLDSLNPEKVQADIDEAKRLDAPLMGTGGGIAGNLAGNVAAFAAVPAAATVKGAALAGGALGALQPVATGESRAVNTTLGAAGGAVGQKVGGYVANKIGARLADKIDEGAAAVVKNAPKDAILRFSRQAGYVLPPSQAGGGVMSRSLEGLSNKINVSQAASQRNQEVTNTLAKRALGLADDAALDAETIKGVKNAAGQVYDEVGALGNVNWDHSFERSVNSLLRKKPGGVTSNPADKEIAQLVDELHTLKNVDGKSLIADIKNLREMAKANYAAARSAQGNVGKTALGDAQSKAAELLEDLAERNLANNGAPADLISRFREARKTLAKTYTVERAMEGKTDVSARRLAAALRKGVPLEGELKTAAQFANQFPKAAQDVSTMGSVPMFTMTDLVMGTAGGVAHPALAAAAVARPAARNLALSPMVQNRLANSQYGPSGALKLADMLAWNPQLRQAQSGLGAAGMIPLSEFIGQ